MPLVDKRYAEALVDAAQSKDTIDSVQEDLKVFAESYIMSGELRNFFHSPEIGKEEKKGALKTIFAGSSDILLPFLLLLIDKGRLESLPGIYREYVEIADKRKKILHLDIRTAAALEDTQLTRLKEKYKKEYNSADVKATVTIDPGLLGGVVVKIGDRVIDASIKGRLQGLKEATVKM